MGLKSNSHHFIGTNGAKKSATMFLNIQLFASKFDVPNTPKKINVEKQMKHLNSDSSKSQLCISISECNDLVNKYSGSGTMISPPQERVNFGKIIGFIDTPYGLKATTWGKIHYSKTGTYIVPYYQQYKKGEDLNDKR